ncbi:MAG: zf-HC2 domain-containing protein [Desulfobulbaceae bacterium]|nr:zf-HC2 domain-containing protein [Desulfobulbaceae bacterium]
MVSESMDRELSFTKKMGVRFHLMMCRYCARFGYQLTRIREMIHAQQEDNFPSLIMDDKVKGRLNHLIEQRKKEQGPS